jgi:hypothetical protein
MASQGSRENKQLNLIKNRFKTVKPLGSNIKNIKRELEKYI